MLEASGQQRMWSSISVWEQWQWQRALESCQKWKPQTSLSGNTIPRNLGPLHLSTVLPSIAQTMHDDDCFYYHSWKNNVVIAFGTLSSFRTQFHIVSGVGFVIWHLQMMKTDNIDVDLAFLELKTLCRSSVTSMRSYTPQYPEIYKNSCI